MNEHKTNFRFRLHIETEEVNKKEDIFVNFNVNIDELTELVKYIRKKNINPQNIKFADIKISEEVPMVIDLLYQTAYNIAFPKHLKDLMWTIADFNDEAEYLMDTDNLPTYDTISYCADEDSYQMQLLQREEEIEETVDHRYKASRNSLIHKLLAKDFITLNETLCELI